MPPRNEARRPTPTAASLGARKELEAAAEAKRFEALEQRVAKYPRAAAYDLETSRLRVAQQLAGNSRAVINVGGGDLVSGLLSVREMSEAGLAAKG